MQLSEQQINLLQELLGYIEFDLTGPTEEKVNKALEALDGLRAQADARPIGKVLSEEEMGVGYDRRTGPVLWFGTPKPGLIYTHPEASAPGLSDDLRRVYEAFGIGEKARNIGVLLVNIENVKRFAEYLDAVEHEFFMVPGEPDEDHPDEEAADECLVNRWGSSKEQYVEQFRAALQRLTRASAATVAEPSVAYDDVFTWLETEISAVDCRYRGDPSYDHDAYWMRERVLKLVKEAKDVFGKAAQQQAEPSDIPPIFYNGDTKRDPALRERINASIRQQFERNAQQAEPDAADRKRFDETTARLLKEQSGFAAEVAKIAKQAEPGADELRYDGLHEYAQANGLDYNELCRVVRAAQSGQRAGVAEELSADDLDALRKAARQFEEYGETEVSYDDCMRFARMGLLDVDAFILSPKGAKLLASAAAPTQQQEGGK